MYTSLHNHTDYSNIRLLDSINTTEKLIDYAVKLGLNGVAITEHDCVGNHVKALSHYKKIKEEFPNFKLILGNEIYLTREGLNATNHEKGERFYHLVLLAKDKIGHDQIREISSKAWERAYFRNMNRVPTYSSDLIQIIGGNPGHLVGSSACLGGYLGTMFNDGDYLAISNHLAAMTALFGENNYYIELQPSYNKNQIDFNRYMVDTYWGTYPFIFTTDSHYLNKNEAEYHKWFLNSKDGDREVDEFYSAAYMMDYNEIIEIFTAGGITSEQVDVMRQNTNKICDSIESYSLEHEQEIPKVQYEVTESVYANAAEIVHESLSISMFDDEDNDTTNYFTTILETKTDSNIYLLHLIKYGYNQLIGEQTNEQRAEYFNRINYELKQIHLTSLKLGKHLADYFITMVKNIDIIWNDGDSLIGPGRGSAGAFLIDYLLGITQVNPLTQPIPLYPWRFIHHSRPGLPDIDIDSEGAKKLKIFNKLRDYFQSIGGDVINICTYGTIGSRKAFEIGGRGLGINEDTIAFIKSLVPKERGQDLTLKQCYYGDENHEPIKTFIEAVDKLPQLWAFANRIEGLVVQLGIHAAGILELNGPIHSLNSVMKTTKGMLVTAFELNDSETMGGLKYDMLTITTLDKIRACMNLALEDGIMDWQGSLRATYNKYLHPDVINYDEPTMWEAAAKGEVASLFQYDSQVGFQAMQQIQPRSLLELSLGNSLMRLMAQQGAEQPIDIFVRQRNNINTWYQSLNEWKLSPEEIKVLEKHLLLTSGVADSQEIVMMLVMDPQISNLSLTEANVLRKAIAKKQKKSLQQAVELYESGCTAQGTSDAMRRYVWDVQIVRQLGYSFSNIHTVAYSIIAIQEMNLYHYYPSIYWKTACLSVDADAINEEDFYNLVDEGIIELADEDDKRKKTKTQYGKLTKAIINYRDTMDIKLPDINASKFGFAPNVKNNSIVFGYKGISMLGEEVIHEIILNKPYTSVQDFAQKMLTESGKKLISKNRIVNLIKAGAFDELEAPKPREEILKDYILSICDQKQKLNLMNFQMLNNFKLIPDCYEFEIKIYNFTKYLRKNKYETYYALDEIAMDFYNTHFGNERIIQNGGKQLISQKYWDSIYNKYMDAIRIFIKENHEELLEKINTRLYVDELQKYARGGRLDWELEAINFYYSGHPLANIELPIEITNINDLVENEFDGSWFINGSEVPKYRLRTIVGTIIDRDKPKTTITLQTPDGAIDVKIFKGQFARYDHTISENDNYGNKIITEPSFLEKGTHLIVTGIYRGNVFIPKVYKSTGFDAILKIDLDGFGKLSCLHRKSEGM